MNGRKKIEELGLIDRAIFSTLGSMLVGRDTSVKLRGSHLEIETVAKALDASKKFQEELSNPSATVKTVMERFDEKKANGKAFEKKFGIPWPL